LYSGSAEGSGRLRCDAMLLGWWFLAFQQNAVSSASGSRSWTTCDPDDEGAMIFQPCGKY